MHNPSNCLKTVWNYPREIVRIAYKKTEKNNFALHKVYVRDSFQPFFLEYTQLDQKLMPHIYQTAIKIEMRKFMALNAAYFESVSTMSNNIFKYHVLKHR